MIKTDLKKIRNKEIKKRYKRESKFIGLKVKGGLKGLRTLKPRLAMS